MSFKRQESKLTLIIVLASAVAAVTTAAILLLRFHTKKCRLNQCCDDFSCEFEEECCDCFDDGCEVATEEEPAE